MDPQDLVDALTGRRRTTLDHPIKGTQLPTQADPWVALAKKAAAHAAPYLQAPEGPLPFTPNAAGKVPVADPFATPLPYAQGAIDLASMLTPAGVGKAVAMASPLVRYLPRVAEEAAPPFYSAAAKALSESKMAKGGADQWLGFLKNAPGVKQEELGTLKLPGGQTFTKDQVLKALEQGGPALKEVNKSGVGTAAFDDLSSEEQHRVREQYREFQSGALGNHSRHIDEGDLRDWFHDYAAEDYTIPGNTKYAQYQLPGGQNYGERLLTLQSQAKPLDVTVKKSGLQMARDSAQRSYVGRTAGHDPATTYQSSHWDEPNVLVHVRHNDRTIPGASPGDPAQKALFLEELQSDWHQAGRKKGYREDSPSGLPPGWKLTPGEGPSPGVWAGDPAGAMGAHGFWAPTAEEATQRAASEMNKTKVPDAPFKTSWPDLALKRMVKHAADQGYDALAWTPGDVQADRYDLSKHLDSVGYNAKDKILQGYKNNMVVLNKAGVAPEDLENHIGKDATEKLLAAEPKEGDPWKMIEGQDLKVGGEGMRAFYDKMLVDKANALGKKYGAKVEQRDLGLNPDELENATPKKAWVLPITPELRKAAKEQGFPLFSAGATAGGAAAAASQVQPDSDQQQTDMYAKALQGAI